MTTMNNSEILGNLQQSLPVSFKVIGIGSETTGIIKKAKSFDYDRITSELILRQASSQVILGLSINAYRRRF